MNFFTPNHVQLLNSCYPPTSVLLASGSGYSPNSQELSRLTYYASNHPEKLGKLGSELEKRVKTECRKFRSGNIRNRAMLLLALSIFRSLATECRRDIALLSPTLLASIEATLSTAPNDLEVVSRAASVFTAWTTYTDGHLIGADSNLTKDYLSILRHFASLSSSEASDHEVRNRTRLIGFAALTGAVNSEALFNDSVQFRTQVSIFMRPVLLTVLQTDLKVLEEQAEGVKDAPNSPYLAEFRTRPVMERRAASIHIHIDGDKGPTMSDVSSAALRALFSLLEHVNGSQLSSIVRSSLDNLTDLKGWSRVEHCCWCARKIAEWSQYQYRYAVPILLVEHLVAQQDTPKVSDLPKALTAMVNTVFSSPVPLVNLSTSDILSNLMMLILRRCSADAEDSLLPSLVQCISSLGRHVYYSDQIHDLATELINRIITVEVHGVVTHGSSNYSSSRTQAVRSLLTGLVGLISVADQNEPEESRSRSPQPTSPSVEAATQDAGLNERHSRRTRVPTDVWQDTLSLLCDTDYDVRADYAQALDFYLDREMPKQGDFTNVDGTKRQVPALNMNALLHGGDSGVKFLHAVHAYLYALATSSSFGLEHSSTPPSENGPVLTIQPATPLVENYSGVDSTDIGYDRRSHPSKSRKMSMSFRLLQQVPEVVDNSCAAEFSDYSHILKILERIHEELPVRGLITSVPMLLALDAACRPDDKTSEILGRIHAIKTVLARTWLAIGKGWECSQLVEIAEQALSNKPDSVVLPEIRPSELGVYHAPAKPDLFPTTPSETFWAGVDAKAALLAIVSNKNIQEATSLDQESLLDRLSIKWTAETALKESVERPSMYDATLRGDGVSPLLKISPGLMHIENLSMQSLARSTRGIGVTELREALEGRSSMSNPALNKPGSISTLDHVSSILGGDSRLTQTRSRTRPKKRAVPAGSGEVRDVLNKLGLGKQNDSLLKSSFPTARPEQQRPSTAAT